MRCGAGNRFRNYVHEYHLETLEPPNGVGSADGCTVGRL